MARAIVSKRTNSRSGVKSPDESFETLTKCLLAVPKAELDAAIEADKERRRKRQSV